MGIEGLPVGLLLAAVVVLLAAFASCRLGRRLALSSIHKRWLKAVSKLHDRIADAETAAGDRYLSADDYSFVAKDISDAKLELAQLEEKVKARAYGDMDRLVALALNVYGRADRVKRRAQSALSKTDVEAPAPVVRAEASTSNNGSAGQ